MKLPLTAIAQFTGGILSPMKTEFITSVSTDTRSIKEGSLFVALKGENFDGHDYVNQAIDSGAVAALVEKWPDDLKSGDFPVIVVKDALRGLQDIAHGYRKTFFYPVFALTGSSGKTSTKDLIRSILNSAGNYLCTEGNLNNHIGVPQTLLKMESELAGAVIEMGMNHQGEIKKLTEIALPEGALITNVGEGHVEFLKDKKGVFNEKIEIFENLRPGSTVIVNMDDEFLGSWNESADKDFDRINYSLSGKDQISVSGKNHLLDVTIKDLKWDDDSWRFKLVFMRGLKGEFREVDIEFPVLGRHQVMNALAASAVCRYFFGITDEHIQAGLKNPIRTHGRMELKKAKLSDSKEVILIDDSYNANPDSTKALIQAGVDHYGEDKSCAVVLVFGDMLELGEKSKSSHEDMGKFAFEKALEGVFTVGAFGQNTLSGLPSDYMGESAHHKDHQDLAKSLNHFIQSTSKSKIVILLKGSRGSKMEKVLEALPISFT